MTDQNVIHFKAVILILPNEHNKKWPQETMLPGQVQRPNPDVDRIEHIGDQRQTSYLAGTSPILYGFRRQRQPA